jgi:hypothetical protein
VSFPSDSRVPRLSLTKKNHDAGRLPAIGLFALTLFGGFLVIATLDTPLKATTPADSRVLLAAIDSQPAARSPFVAPALTVIGSAQPAALESEDDAVFMDPNSELYLDDNGQMRDAAEEIARGYIPA